MKIFAGYIMALALTFALGLAGCFDPSKGNTATGPDGDIPKDSVTAQDSIKPPLDTVQPPVDTVQPPVDTVQPPVDTVQPPVDTLQPPVDTLPPPTGKPKQYPWEGRDLPCDTMACQGRPIWPGDTLYVSARKDGATRYMVFPVEAAKGTGDFSLAVAAFLRDSLAAGSGTKAEYVTGTHLSIHGNSEAIKDFRIRDNRLGLMWIPLDLPAGSVRGTVVLQIGAGMSMMDCMSVVCPDSLTRGGDTLFFSVEKNGQTVSTPYYLPSDSYSSFQYLTNALEAFLRSGQVDAGFLTQVQWVTQAQSATLYGSITLYGNTASAITGLRIRNSRLGEIIGPVYAPIGTAQLAVRIWLPTIYRPSWPAF